MTDKTGNPYTSRTDASLAELCTKLATSVRSFSAEDREQLLLAVAERLTHDTDATIDIDGYTYVQSPATGDLCAPDGRVLAKAVTLDVAQAIAVAVATMSEASDA